MQDQSTISPKTTVQVSASTSTASAALTPSGHVGRVRVLNAGSVVTYVKFGGASVTATAADLALGPNEAVIVDAGAHTHIAALTASSTATVHATTLAN